MTRRHYYGRSIATAIALALLLTFAAAGVAAVQDDAPHSEHGQMAKPAMMAGGMMAMHKEMHAKMQAMDERLDELVAEMNAASGKAKTEATAAVVAELVSQRKAMHGMMMEMQPRMMDHMMEHMRSGMMDGMKKAMGDCPMMKAMPSEDEPSDSADHSEHHG